MSIFVTGDIHGQPFPRLQRSIISENELTKDDYVIICGDFGLVWERHESRTEEYYLDKLEELPFTVLFVDGNHENFDRLNALPAVPWHGGMVHQIRPHVLHLMRGYVFDINGKKVFAMGGASSHDISDGIIDLNNKKDMAKYRCWKRDGTLFFREFRILHQSWWPEELPSQEEYDRARANLDTCDWKVDFIITHSPSTSILAELGHGKYKSDKLSDFLEEIRQRAKYRKWYAGHMHVNEAVTAKDHIIYRDIEQID